MTSKEYLTATLSTVFRALNTMEGLICEARATIPDNILNDEGPEDATNGENLGVTFSEIQRLRDGCREIVNGIMNMNEDDTGETAFFLIDWVGKYQETMNHDIDDILDKYKGDTVSDEF